MNTTCKKCTYLNNYAKGDIKKYKGKVYIVCKRCKRVVYLGVKVGKK